MDVGDGRGNLDRERYGTVSRHAVDVVHPEANAFQMKGSNRAAEAFCLFHQRPEMGMWRQTAHQLDEVLHAMLGRLTGVS